jgi:endo-1,4-beta-mannosidase
VAEAKNYGIRLLLSLTNGDTGFGGMEQYVKWARGGRKGGSITDFYNSKELRVRCQTSIYCQRSASLCRPCFVQS